MVRPLGYGVRPYNMARSCCTCSCCLLCVAVTAVVVAVAVRLIQPAPVEGHSHVTTLEYFAGKRVIVTGASRGIGRGLAIELARLGSRLVVAARSEATLNQTRDECLQYTSADKVVTVIADVGEESDCHRIADAVLDHFGGLDVLILNAAYSPRPSLVTELDNPGERILHVFKVNTIQSVYLTTMLLSELEKTSGIIVGVSSMAGLLGFPKIVAYDCIPLLNFPGSSTLCCSTSKHALHGYLKSLHSELALTGSNVTVTLMPLPYVRTDKAVEYMKPFSDSTGLTVQDCVMRMLQGIPLRQFFYYITWDTFLAGHLSSLSPSLFQWIVRTTMLYWYENI